MASAAIPGVVRWAAALVVSGGAAIAAFTAGWGAHAALTDEDPAAPRAVALRDVRGSLANDGAAPAVRRTGRRAEPPVDAAPSGLDGPPGADITGRVRDAQGRPVAGVLVRVEPEAIESEEPEFQSAYDVPDADRPLAEMIRELVAAEARRRGGRREATTGADGTFRVTGLVAGATYDVGATLSSHWMKTDGDSQSYGVAPGDSVDFVALPLSEFRAEIVLPDGSSAAAATVVLHEESGEHTYRWTPAHGTFQVDPGMVSLAASLPGFRGEVRDVAVAPFGTVSARVLLHAVHEVRVHVTWPEGATRFGVTCLATQDESPDGAYGDPEAEVEGDTAVFRDLAAGKWWIRAQYTSERIARREQVDTTAGPAELRWELPPLDARDFVIVRVLDSAGRALEAAEVEGSSGYFCTVANSPAPRVIEPGVFRVTHARRFDLADAWFQVRAKSREFGERTAAYVAGTDAEVTIRFPPSSRLTVLLTVPGDRYVRVAPVLPDPGAEDLAAFADEEGRVSFEHVPHGEYEVRADAVPGTAMRVKVPAAGPVAYEGTPCNAWRLVDVRADGAAAAAGLRAGDTIVGVDGEEFADAAHRDAAWAAALARDRFDALVRRDGATLTVPLVVQIAFDPGKFGASLAESLP